MKNSNFDIENILSVKKVDYILKKPIIREDKTDFMKEDKDHTTEESRYSMEDKEHEGEKIEFQIGKVDYNDIQKDNLEKDNTQKDNSKNNTRNRIKNVTKDLTDEQYLLYDSLRTLRYEIAKEEHIPVYRVFTNQTLVDMCTQLPQNLEEILEVKGVGEKKKEKYGEKFIDAIIEFGQKSAVFHQFR